MSRKLLQVIVATTIAWSGTSAQGNIDLPDLGDDSAAVISPYQEKKLGEEFMRNAHRFLDISEDAQLSEYIQTLGTRLVRNSDTPSQAFHFFVVNDPTINAFAVPGGFVGVNAGLILAARNEAELAAVMAHEIAHVTQRHIPRMAAEDKHASGQAMAALVAAILLSGTSPTGGQALAALATGAYAQNQLNFSRAFEQEADRLGIVTLARAGFSADAMPSFFERLQSWNRLNETNLPEFLRTHPITGARISESRDRAERHKAPATPADNDHFFHAQARIRALAKGSPPEIVKSFADSRKEVAPERAAAEQYGYAVALLRAREFDSAREQANALIRRSPRRVSYQILQADIELAQDRPKEALKIFRRAIDQDRSSNLLRRSYAEALLASGDGRRAKEVLRELVRGPSPDPALYKMLARAAGDTGALVEAHQAMAEFYYLSGNPDLAIEQLRIALRFAQGSHYASASVDARMKEIRNETAQWQTKKN